MFGLSNCPDRAISNSESQQSIKVIGKVKQMHFFISYMSRCVFVLPLYFHHVKLCLLCILSFIKWTFLKVDKTSHWIFLKIIYVNNLHTQSIKGNSKTLEKLPEIKLFYQKKHVSVLLCLIIHLVWHPYKNLYLWFLQFLWQTQNKKRSKFLSFKKIPPAFNLYNHVELNAIHFSWSR